MKYVGLVEAEETLQLEGVEPRLRHRSFHLVFPNGGVVSGAKAIPALIGLLPAGRPISFVLERFHPTMRCVSFVYSVFSRLHDSGACGSIRDPTGKTRNFWGPT